MSLEQLRNKTWDIIEPLYLQKTNDLIKRFHEAQAHFLDSSDIAEVPRADRIYPERIDLKTGELIERVLFNPKIDDVLDDLAEIVFKSNGKVVVLPEERMPVNTGVAAMFRF